MKQKVPELSSKHGPQKTSPAFSVLVLILLSSLCLFLDYGIFDFIDSESQSLLFNRVKINVHKENKVISVLLFCFQSFSLKYRLLTRAQMRNNSPGRRYTVHAAAAKAFAHSPKT